MSGRFTTTLAALAVGLCAAGAPRAQEQRPTFSSRADLVVVRVHVSERKSGAVPGLDRDAFRVYEDGVAQRVALFSKQDSPATIGLLLDNSDSMAPKRDQVIAGARAFARASNPEDELFVVNFNEHVRLGLPEGTPFTSDLMVLQRALLQSKARGMTGLYDAVSFALDHVNRGAHDQKALVVLSDGRDTASRTPFDRVIEKAHASDTVIYTIGLSEPGEHDAARGVLTKLARTSGGEHHFPKDLTALSAVLDRIARDIRSSYTIGYVPEGAAARPGGYRRLRVVVTTPDRRKISVRHRAGYLAASETSGQVHDDRH